MFDHASTDGRVRVYEGQTAFYIVLLSDGTEKCIGDMVGIFHSEDCEPLMVGTDAFYDAFRADIDGDTSGWIYAYFGGE